MRQRVFDLLLDHALQRAGAERRVVADRGDAVAGRPLRTALDFARFVESKIIAVLGGRFMPAIEFHTTINDGVIAVPPEHLPLLAGGGATVIVVPDAKPASAPNLIDKLLAQPVRAAGFQPLARDEAHAR